MTWLLKRFLHEHVGPSLVPWLRVKNKVKEKVDMVVSSCGLIAGETEAGGSKSIIVVSQFSLSDKL